MALPPILTRPLAAFFVISALAACGGRTIGIGVSSDSGFPTNAGSPVRDTGSTKDTAPPFLDSGRTVEADGAICIDLSPASWSLACTHDSDCTSLPSGPVCQGQCKNSCDGVPANTAGVARFTAATSSLGLIECACTMAPVPTCFQGVCTFCGETGSSSCFDAGGDGGSTEGSCPSALPAAGDACDGTLECEYGTDPDVRCDTVVTCTGGTWFTTQSPSSSDCATTNPATCPADYADVGTMCSDPDTTCVYPQARCSCSTGCGEAGFSTPEWCCPDAAPGGSACPSPRPRIGSACTTAGQECDYGFCLGNVALQCDAGTWQPDDQEGCPG